MWTLFWDMHSGGRTKEPPFEKIYIEAPREEAKVIFYNRFGHNPERITCTCCGEDYSISESETFEQASGWHRNCKYDKSSNQYIEKADRSYGKYITVEDYQKQENVKVIFASEITVEEKRGEVPQQGYVWV